MNRRLLPLFIANVCLWSASYGGRQTDLLDKILGYSESGKDLNAEVLKLSQSEDIDDRVVAASLMGVYSSAFRKETTIPVLRTLLKDASERVRIAAVNTVGRLADSPSTVEIASNTVLKNFVADIRRLAHSKNQPMRMEAERTLDALKRRRLEL
jgi:HEAT repeat protein